MLGAVLLAAGCGCDGLGPVFPVQVSAPDRISPALLLSEVQQSESPGELLERDFLLENRSSTPQTLTLAAKSCSCYGANLDGVPLELHTPFTIAPGSSRVLTLDVVPPDQPAENSWTVRLASRDDPGQELSLTLRVRVVADIRLEPDAIVTSMPSDSVQRPSGSTSAHRHDLVIRHTWRSDNGESGFPTLTGLPEGWESTVPVVVEERRQVEDGLWQESWLTTVQRQRIVATEGGPVPATDSSPAAGGLAAGLQAAVQRPASPGVKKPESGVHRLQVSFESRSGDAVRVLGRFVVREPAGVTAPTVVHWGTIPVGESRTRRIMLSASDDRAFSMIGVTNGRLLQDEPLGEGTPADADLADPSGRGADRQQWSFRSADLDLAISPHSPDSQTHQCLQLDLVPLREGTIDETVTLETDHPLTSTINVRLMAIVTRTGSETAEVQP